MLVVAVLVFGVTSGLFWLEVTSFAMNVIGILMVGGAAVLLLGIKRKRG